MIGMKKYILAWNLIEWKKPQMHNDKISPKILREINSLVTTQCGNYGNSLSCIFGKNFEKATVLLNKLLKSWFDEIIFWWERSSAFSTLCGILRRVDFTKYSVKVTFSFYHTHTITVSQCRNYGNSHSRIFGKYYVKATVLLNRSLKS